MNNPEETKILHLSLTKKWFDMIASGEKIQEYRELKPFWINRLAGDNDDCIQWDVIRFTNGYGKHRLQWMCSAIPFTSVKANRNGALPAVNALLSTSGKSSKNEIFNTWQPLPAQR